jgi:hypothetical protein
MQSLKQCTWIHSQSHKDDESMKEISGELWLSSQGCYVNANDQEGELELAKGLKQRAPTNRAVGLLTAHFSGPPDVLVRTVGRVAP